MNPFHDHKRAMAVKSTICIDCMVKLRINLRMPNECPRESKGELKIQKKELCWIHDEKNGAQKSQNVDAACPLPIDVCNAYADEHKK